ncbi:proton-conducting transporter transmembrane domain-containing protein [Halobellus marinus]|uniref:proton-conducting transporter transmembrane domain-containing protein n=1 Tax=Halobellus TaxID=1073986 RepID=UPI0028AE4DEF|nr:proton-conducting transporter membrane subunit [Halobellus sp. DFY28]
MTDALALLVVVPIVLALVPIAIGRLWDRSGWVAAAVAALAHLGLSLSVARSVFATGRSSYAVGDFTPPFGIELVADGVSATLVLLVSAVTLGIVLYARTAGPHSSGFYSGLLLLTAGISGVFVTGDLFNLYVFIEITGLATYALVATGRSPAAAMASLKYLLVGTIGASLYLLGVGYLYISTGSLNMANLAELLPTVGYDSPLVLTGFGLIVVGLAVKTALFPLHTWQPDAYAESPDSVTAYISALVSTAAAYALFRIIYVVFTPAFDAAVPFALDTLVILASVSVVVGSVLAVLQSDLKRMLAYSSVAQFGLVIAGFAVINTTAATGGLVHLVGHAVMKAGLFVGVGALAGVAGGRTVDDLAGIADRAPVVSAAVAVLAFALVGVPPAVGFAGKWHIVLGAVEGGRPIVAAVAVVSTLLTLAYFARVIERMYFREAPALDDVAEEAAENAVAADGGSQSEPNDDEAATGDDPDAGDEADSGADTGADPDDDADLPSEIPSVSFEARLVVVAAAVGAVLLGLFASDLIAFVDPVLEVYFQ